MEVIFEAPIDSIKALDVPASVVVDHLGPDCSICLFYGDLGAGKTTLIKNICSKFGVPADMSSPSFALVNEYLTQDGMTIYHFDFYRINQVAEIYDLGHEEYFHSGSPCFVEWPEIAEDLLPSNHLKVKIDHLAGSTRHITISRHD